jgi:hypothetical protein
VLLAERVKQSRAPESPKIVSLCEVMKEQAQSPTAAEATEQVLNPAVAKKQVQTPAPTHSRPLLPTDKAPKEWVRQSRVPQGPKIVSVDEEE